MDYSELGTLGENAGVELHCLGHVALDLHLSVHEGILWLELAGEKLHEVVVEHDEGRVGFALLGEGDLSVAVFEVDGDDFGGVFLRLAELEVVDSTDFGDDCGTLRLELGSNFLENFD